LPKRAGLPDEPQLGVVGRVTLPAPHGTRRSSTCPLERPNGATKTPQASAVG